MDAYEKKALIKGGSFGEVFTAVRKGEKEIYAMKVMKIRENIDERFINNEISLMRTICTMNHPNIIRYIDHFWDKAKSQCTIIMEYCPKGSLEKVLSESSEMGERLFEKEILKYLFDILSGVEFIHQQKIVHRDLKPKNILIGNDGHLKICGFGIFRQLRTTRIHTISSIGTLGYASLEVLNEGKYSDSADMWSIGCILYELCCFKLPYPIKETSLNEYIEFIRRGKLDLSKIPLSYNVKLRELIPIMLSLNPSLRENCTKLLDRQIFETFTFKRRVIYYPTGKKYDGEYKDGMRNGKGILYLTDGSRYEGEWINDMKVGKGIKYCNDGMQIYEEWDEGNYYEMYYRIFDKKGCC